MFVRAFREALSDLKDGSARNLDEEGLNISGVVPFL